MFLFYQHMNISGLLKKEKLQFCHSLGLIQVAPLYFSFSSLLSEQIFYSRESVLTTPLIYPFHCF